MKKRKSDKVRLSDFRCDVVKAQDRRVCFWQWAAFGSLLLVLAACILVAAYLREAV